MKASKSYQDMYLCIIYNAIFDKNRLDLVNEEPRGSRFDTEIAIFHADKKTIENVLISLKNISHFSAVAYQVHHIRNIEISLMPNTHEIIKIFEI